MAELKEILGDNDFTINLSTVRYLPNTLTRAKVEKVLEDHGYTVPLPNNVSFYIGNDTKVFLVRYLLDSDAYVYEKLLEAL